MDGDVLQPKHRTKPFPSGLSSRSTTPEAFRQKRSNHFTIALVRVGLHFRKLRRRQDHNVFALLPRERSNVHVGATQTKCLRKPIISRVAMHKPLFPNRIERGVSPSPRGFDFGRSWDSERAPVWVRSMRGFARWPLLTAPKWGAVDASHTWNHPSVAVRTLHWMALKQRGLLTGAHGSFLELSGVNMTIVAGDSCGM